MKRIYIYIYPYRWKFPSCGERNRANNRSGKWRKRDGKSKCEKCPFVRCGTSTLDIRSTRASLFSSGACNTCANIARFVGTHARREIRNFDRIRSLDPLISILRFLDPAS